MVCGCVWTKNIKILAARARVLDQVFTRHLDGGRETQALEPLWVWAPGREKAPRDGPIDPLAGAAAAGDDDARRARTTGSDSTSETQVCAFLFQLITAVQFFFALSINSMSLMMDCISMEIDVVTYLGNLYGPPTGACDRAAAKIPAKRKRLRATML